MDRALGNPLGNPLGLARKIGAEADTALGEVVYSKTNLGDKYIDISISRFISASQYPDLVGIFPLTKNFGQYTKSAPISTPAFSNAYCIISPDSKHLLQVVSTNTTSNSTGVAAAILNDTSGSFSAHNYLTIDYDSTSTTLGGYQYFRGLAFSPENKSVLLLGQNTTSGYRSIEVRLNEGGASRGAYYGVTGIGTDFCAAFSPEGTRVVVFSDYRTEIRAYVSDVGVSQSSLRTYTNTEFDTIRAACFTPEGDRLVCLDAAGIATVEYDKVAETLSTPTLRHADGNLVGVSYCQRIYYYEPAGLYVLVTSNGVYHVDASSYEVTKIHSPGGSYVTYPDSATAVAPNITTIDVSIVADGRYIFYSPSSGYSTVLVDVLTGAISHTLTGAGFGSGALANNMEFMAARSGSNPIVITNFNGGFGVQTPAMPSILGKRPYMRVKL